MSDLQSFEFHLCSPLKLRAMNELTYMYVNAQGELCVEVGKSEMLVTAFGTCILGDYLVYVPNKK